MSRFANPGDAYPYSPWEGTPPLRGWNSYYPPVPCEDINEGKYTPEWVGGRLSVGSYREWTPTVGKRPPPGW